MVGPFQTRWPDISPRRRQYHPRLSRQIHQELRQRQWPRAPRRYRQMDKFEDTPIGYDEDSAACVSAFWGLSRESEMVRTHRFSTTGVIVCLVCVQWSGTLAAQSGHPNEGDRSSLESSQSTVTSAKDATSLVSFSLPRATVSNPSPGSLSITELSRLGFTDSRLTPVGPAAAAPIWRDAFKFEPAESTSMAQRRWVRGRGGRHGAAQAAVVLGAVAAIAGTAVLVYANRPECSTNQLASGCGYGTKVVGGAVLTAGAVGIVVGALTW